jgi:predicted NBD/HSP70 family sugar kinase
MTERSLRARTREELFALILERGEVTRSELAALTGMSRSTINQSLGRLVADGRVVEVDNEAKGPGSGRGRPAVRVRAVGTGAAVAGIDFGHTHVYVGIGDTLGRTIGTEKLLLDVDLQADQAMDAAVSMLETLRTRHEVSELAGVVAGIPGPLDRHNGLVQSPTILSGWVGLAPADELARRIGTPVTVENDAVLGALGELYCGAGHGLGSFLYVKASHGIGASIVIDGRPFRGATGLAGEIGHTNLAGRSELCRCGSRGCLEAVVSVGTVREQIAHTRPGTDPSTIDLAVEADSITARILDSAGRTLGRVLADLCNLLNPAALIVGGELGRADGPLIDGIREAVRLHAQPATADALVVRPAALGVDAELTGAVQLAARSAAVMPPQH